MDVRALGQLSLPDPEGKEHKLEDMWADQPVVLVFLRHFG